MRTWSQFVIPCNNFCSQPHSKNKFVTRSVSTKIHHLNLIHGQVWRILLNSNPSTATFRLSPETRLWISKHPHKPGRSCESYQNIKLTTPVFVQIRVFPTFLKQNNYSMFNFLDIWTAQCYSTASWSSGAAIASNLGYLPWTGEKNILKTLPFNTPRLWMDQGWS